MDTQWFAIDDRGHVGVCNSHDTGQVPEAHFTAWDQGSAWSDLLAEMLRLAAPGELHFVADGVFVVPKLRYEEAVLVNEPFKRLAGAFARWWLGARSDSKLPIPSGWQFVAIDRKGLAGFGDGFYDSAFLAHRGCELRLLLQDGSD